MKIIIRDLQNIIRSRLAFVTLFSLVFCFMCSYFSDVSYTDILEKCEHERQLTNNNVNVIEIPFCDYKAGDYERVMESYVELPIPKIKDTSFKTYMDYRTITDRKSAQWQLQQQAKTNENGFRMIDGKYLIAIGTYYSYKCGDEYRITLEDGTVFEAIIGDIKDPRHTNRTNQYVPLKDGKGNVIEFIVDTRKMKRSVLMVGDVSHLGLQGNIARIEKREE